MYHHLANNERIKYELRYSDRESRMIRNDNYLKRVWWWHIFCYFERNVPHNLPHKFSLPLPKKIQDSGPILFIKRKLRRDNNDAHSDDSTSSLLASSPVVGYSSMRNSMSQND